MHIMRTMVEIRLDPGKLGDPASKPPVQARLLLNDLGPQGMGIFSPEPMSAGQDVSLVLTELNNLFLKGKVVYCQEHGMDSHVISQTPFSYRIGIQFKFESPADEAAVKKYYEDLMKALMPAA